MDKLIIKFMHNDDDLHHFSLKCGVPSEHPLRGLEFRLFRFLTSTFPFTALHIRIDSKLVIRLCRIH